MRTRTKRAFRPMAEGFEDRALTTGGAGGAAALAAHGNHAAAHVGALGLGAHRRGGPLHPLAAPPGTMIIGPGLGEGLVRLAMPLNYVKWGVVTLWNNTRDTVNFGVSASTYAAGTYFSFSLGSGQFRSFYAPFVNGRVAPVFHIALNPNYRPVVLPQQNIVFEDPSYLPQGTAGRPYAINLGVNGLRLSFV